MHFSLEVEIFLHNAQRHCPAPSSMPSLLHTERMFEVYRKKTHGDSQSSPGEVLPKADGEPVSNGSVDDMVAPLPIPPWAPKEDWVWSGELMVSVPVVEISVVWASLVLADRDLNVLPPPLAAVVETEALVVGKSVLLSVDRMLNDTWLLPVAKM